MRRMNKIKAVSLCLALALAALPLLAGCGRGGAVSSPPGALQTDLPQTSNQPAAQGIVPANTEASMVMLSRPSPTSPSQTEQTSPSQTQPTGPPQTQQTNPSQPQIPAQPTSTAAQSAAPPQAADASGLFRGVQDIFRSKRFTLKGKSGGKPITMVMDTDRMAMESTGGQELFKASGADALQAMLLEGLTGKTVRYLVTPGKEYYVFPERNVYLNMTGVGEAFPKFAGDLAQANGEVKSAVVTLGGTEYLRGTAADSQGVTWSLYFLGGNLRRIEAAGGSSTLIEVDSLSATPESKYLSVSGMALLDLSALAGLG